MPIHNTLQISSLPPLSSLSLFPSHPCPVPVTINSTPCTQTHTRKPQRDTNSTNTENREPTPAAVGEEEKRTREKCGETTDTRNRRSLNILFHTIKQLAQCWGESLTVWVRDKHRHTSVTAWLPSPQALFANNNNIVLLVKIINTICLESSQFKLKHLPKMCLLSQGLAWKSLFTVSQMNAKNSSRCLQLPVLRWVVTPAGISPSREVQTPNGRQMGSKKHAKIILRPSRWWCWDQCLCPVLTPHGVFL